jgi:hypothetical protein
MGLAIKAKPHREKRLVVKELKDNNYDYSFTINASQDIQRMTFKVNKDPDIKDDPTTAFHNVRSVSFILLDQSPQQMQIDGHIGHILLIPWSVLDL